MVPLIFLVAQQPEGPEALMLFNYHLSTCHWLTEALTNLRTLPQSGRASGWENKRGGILWSSPPVGWLKRWVVLMAAWLSDHRGGHITDNSTQRGAQQEKFCLSKPIFKASLGAPAIRHKLVSAVDTSQNNHQVQSFSKLTNFIIIFCQWNNQILVITYVDNQLSLHPNKQ